MHSRWTRDGGTDRVLARTPIGMSPESGDLIVAAGDGRVDWLGEELIQRFEDFDEFFLTMADANRRELSRFDDPAFRVRVERLLQAR